MQPPAQPPSGAIRDESTDAAALLGKQSWEAGIAHARLSNHLPPWRQHYLLGEWRTEATHVYGGLRQTERYHLDDREGHLGTVLRLGATHRLQLEAGASDTHHVLPMRYGAIHWHHQPAPAWSLTAGLRHSRYESASTDAYSLGGEHYVGAERFAYTLFAGGPTDSSLTASQRLQWTHHYHDAGWITLSLLRGKESEYAAPTGLLTSRVSGRALNGQHGIAPGWAIVWAIEHHRQGDLHTRNGVQLGIRHDY
jgi:YaiO family outer membrane protein